MVAITDLNGWYKTRYGEKQKLVPEFAVLQQLIEFEQRKQLGKDFREPIFLRRSQGVTFNSGSNLGTIYTLNAAIPLASVEAIVTPSEIVMREQLAYGAVAAAYNQGPEAFGSAMDEVILGLDESHRAFVEALMLYGASSTGLGVISAVAANDATSKKVTITSASWSPGLWAQMEKASFDVYASDGTTKRTANALMTFDGFSDVDNKVLILRGNATDVGNLAANDIIVFYQAGAPATAIASGSTFVGVDAIVTNTGSLFNISAATYNLWKGNTYALPTAAPLTMSALHGAATRVVVRGGYGDITFLMSPYAWQDICDDQAALRRYADSNKKEFVNGATELTFYGTNGGKMVLRPHPMVKAGDCFGLMTDEWVRAGVSDLTDRLPGTGNEDFFLEIPDKSGFEIRNFSSQFVYCRKPAKQVKITNIVPRTAP